MRVGGRIGALCRRTKWGFHSFVSFLKQNLVYVACFGIGIRLVGLPPECLVFLVDSVDGLSKLW